MEDKMKEKLSKSQDSMPKDVMDQSSMTAIFGRCAFSLLDVEGSNEDPT